MIDRAFTEVDLRVMLETAEDLSADLEQGRWVAQSSYNDRVWQVIVEPDGVRKLLVVVTAYPTD